ncbi:MAG: right-handed parallel beta-helix repeat-containing protein, partial [Anaerolineae bacterium]|nr:right-handed parallel beta-helix repeat-containing protein [Anaerolineae bacterium]
MEKDKKHTGVSLSVRIVFRILVLAALLISVGPTRPARAGVVFIVDDVGDAGDNILADGVCLTAGGVCTLRAAIEQANDLAGPDLILFNIAGPTVISPTSGPLPAITGTLEIDGTSQPGIELDGSGVSGNGLEISADNSKIFGLVIRDFDGAGILINAANGGVVVSGNYIGTDLAGAAAAPNGVGIHILESPDNIIGGTLPGYQNTISGNTGAGIVVEGALSDGNKIFRNFIGLNSGGGTALGNGAEGILVDGAVNTEIGSSILARVNIISANVASGVTITNNAAGTKILGNRIGTNYARTLPLGNGGHGVLADSFNVHIGWTVVGSGNFIAHNALDGVAVTSGFTKVTILRNSIYKNGGLGIDLADDGITANDQDDPDSGENNLQNYPVISSAQVSGTNLTLVGGLNSLANESFRLEFFFGDNCDASGHGESGRFIHAMKVTTDGLGNYSLNTTFTATVDPGDYITATATFLNGGTVLQDTSEISACWQVSVAPTPTPTKTLIPTATPTGDGGGGGGGGFNSPTPSKTPWPTITGTPPTNTPIPTWTSNPPQKTL